jgi:hypothetical protein
MWDGKRHRGRLDGDEDAGPGRPERDEGEKREDRVGVLVYTAKIFCLAFIGLIEGFPHGNHPTRQTSE